MAEFKRKPKSRGPKKSGGRSTDRRSSSRPGRRDSRGSGRSRRDSGSKFGRRSFDRPERTKVICDSCGKECEVPFKPTSNKPIYCDDCFKKTSGSKSKDYGKELVEINQKLDKIMKILEIKK